MAYSIETFDLSRAFNGVPAVEHLNLRVEEGSFYGFLGPNGAGKSTTMKMLTGLLAPTSGTARVFGMDLRHDALAIKQRIGVMPETLALFENLTAREHLTFIARMYGTPRPVIETRIEELLSLLGLADTGKKLIVEFSHGMRKKLALAAALIHDPELLFLDEPFEGIDAIASRTIRAVLARFIERGSTIFLTSHILEIIEKLCTHVGIIHNGGLARQGSMAELAAQGESLETIFVDAVGRADHPEVELSWLRGGSHEDR